MLYQLTLAKTVVFCKVFRNRMCFPEVSQERLASIVNSRLSFASRNVAEGKKAIRVQLYSRNKWFANQFDLLKLCV